MRLLRAVIDGAELFRDDHLAIDLFAIDRVPKPEGGLRTADVTQMGESTSIYSQNVVGISGVNASGKTTALNLLHFVLDLLAGEVTLRGFRENTLTGHNALTDELFYGTAVVTLLADLTYFNNALAYRKACTDSKSVKLNTLCCKIFGENTVAKTVGGKALAFVNALFCKQAHLTVPLACMGVVFEAEVLYHNTRVN